MPPARSAAPPFRARERGAKKRATPPPPPGVLSRTLRPPYPLIDKLSPAAARGRPPQWPRMAVRPPECRRECHHRQSGAVVSLEKLHFKMTVYRLDQNLLYILRLFAAKCVSGRHDKSSLGARPAAADRALEAVAAVAGEGLISLINVQACRLPEAGGHQASSAPAGPGGGGGATN